MFGIQSWVKVTSYTQPRNNIFSYQPWHIQVNHQWQAIRAVEGRIQGKTLVTKIKDIDNRNLAKSLVGSDIYIDKSQLPILEKDRYYWDDLIGLQVFNQQNINLGQVMHLVDTGANYVLVVIGQKKEYWVPYVAPYLVRVDIACGLIEVDWDEDF